MKILNYIIIAVYLGLILVMGYATFVEQSGGAELAARRVYHSVWFILLWAALVLLGGVYMTKRKLFRQLPLCLLHFSFVVILAGAAVTFFFGQKGTVHLRQGEPVSLFISSEKHIGMLPFQLALDTFQITYYPSTQAPSDFISRISYTDDLSLNSADKDQNVATNGNARTAVVSMNRVFSHRGYRFYQSSFDPDMRGSVLAVNYDPYGTAITYLGYLLLALSMIMVLISKQGGFRRLLRSPLLKGGAPLALCLFFLCGLDAPARSLPTINDDKAASVARYQVVYNNRVSPLNTVAVDFLQKIYGRRSYKGLSAEQVLYGWMARPEVWKQEKMILIKNASLRQRLGIRQGRYASMQDLFDATGTYKLLSMAPMEQDNTPFAKSLRQTDEKAGLILMLVNRQLFTPLPKGAARLSNSRVEAEILYNKVSFSKILFMVNLTAGVILFVCLLFSIAGKIRPALGKKIRLLGIAVLAFSFTFALCGYLLRWYVGGRVPLSNGYETMLLMALLLMALTLALCRRFAFIVPMGLMLSGFALLVSHLGAMSPQITPLMPVLHSPLLSVHVGVIMVAYSLLAFMMLNGVFALVLIHRTNPLNININTRIVARLTVLSRLMLYPAVFLLAAGIFLGAVWANQSWGAYWSWDPKETWALITLMVYAVAFHRGSLPIFNKDLFFHLYMIIAFLAVLMTYFGVNYFMGGMHSYA